MPRTVIANAYALKCSIVGIKLSKSCIIQDLRVVTILTRKPHLEVEVQTLLKSEALWKAFVLLHVVGQGEVPVRGVLLRQEHRVVEAERELMAGLEPLTLDITSLPDSAVCLGFAVPRFNLRHMFEVAEWCKAATPNPIFKKPKTPC